MAARSGTGRDSEDGSGLRCPYPFSLCCAAPFLLSYQQFAFSGRCCCRRPIFTFN